MFHKFVQTRKNYFSSEIIHYFNNAAPFPPLWLINNKLNIYLSHFNIINSPSCKSTLLRFNDKLVQCQTSRTTLIWGCQLVRKLMSTFFVHHFWIKRNTKAKSMDSHILIYFHSKCVPFHWGTLYFPHDVRYKIPLVIIIEILQLKSVQKDLSVNGVLRITLVILTLISLLFLYLKDNPQC